MECLSKLTKNVNNAPPVTNSVAEHIDAEVDYVIPKTKEKHYQPQESSTNEEMIVIPNLGLDEQLNDPSVERSNCADKITSENHLKPKAKRTSNSKSMNKLAEEVTSVKTPTNVTKENSTSSTVVGNIDQYSAAIVPSKKARKSPRLALANTTSADRNKVNNAIVEHEMQALGATRHGKTPRHTVNKPLKPQVHDKSSLVTPNKQTRRSNRKSCSTAKIESRNRKGETPLHVACIKVDQILLCNFKSYLIIS